MISFTLLALLTEHPTYGYDLKRRFDKRGGTAWCLNIGQVFGSLKYLRRRGWVMVVPSVNGNGRRVYYQPTAKGRHAVDRWLKKPPRPLAAIRDDLWLRMLLMDLSSNRHLHDHLLAAIQYERGRLDRLRTERARHDQAARGMAALPALGLEGAVFHAEAHLRWLLLCLAVIEDATELTCQ